MQPRRQGGKQVDIMSKSEVARLRREIALSYQACLSVFESPGITAPHAFITAKMEKIAEYQEQLIDIVGSDAATRITVEAMRKAGEVTSKDTG